MNAPLITPASLIDRWVNMAEAREDRDEPDEQPSDGTPKPPTLWVDADGWEEGAIAPRPWVARGYMMRGAVSVLSGPGSAGKSSLMVGWAIASALGVRWHRFFPANPLKVMLYNTEDDRDEQRRRMSATLRQFDRLPRDLAGKVVRVGPSSTGTLLRRDPFTGKLRPTAAMDELEALVEQHKPDVLVLDPLVELHDAEENDNTAVRMVMARFRSMAIKHNMAVVLIHHSRKGVAGAYGDPDTLRGASAIVGAARIVLTVMTMDEDQANKLGIDPRERSRYFRVDGAKSNYAPLHEAEWFERVEYELDNGEKVAAAVPWEAPSIHEGLTAETLNRALDRIAAGPTPGQLYTPTKRGGSSRWCGQPLMDEAGIEEPRASVIVSQWFKNGLLQRTEYHHPDLRRAVPGVVVNNQLRPSV